MKITKELLRRHRLGLCTEEEKKAVEEWLEMEENTSTGLNLIKGDDRKKEQIWSQLSQDYPELNEPAMSRAKGTVPLSMRFVRYAAVAVILFTAGIFSYQYSDQILSEDTGQSIALKTINTQRGEKRTVTLSDGSTIRMNYETEIKAPEKFEGNQRVLYLTGHAHFDVVRDTERPFIIYTEDSKTQVLGTSFDINTKEVGATEIIVTSGKVAFSEKDKASNLVTLKLNDRAVLGADKKIATDEVDALSMTAWKDNRLVFNGETLKEVIKVLEPWYDVTILVQDSDLLTKDFKWSGDNPPLETVMRELSFAGQFEYRIKEKTVSIF